MQKVERPQQAIRRARLIELLAEAGGAKAMNGLLKKPPKDPYLTSCKTSRNLGDDMATAIERVMQRPIGWMDEDRRSGWPFQGIARGRFDALDADQKIEIQGAVRRMIADFEASPRAANDSRPGDLIETADYKGEDRRNSPDRRR